VLNKIVADIRSKKLIKPSSLSMPTAVWTGKDLFEGSTIDTLTLIFKTIGCDFGKKGGCTMCGFVYDSATTPPSHEEILSQFDKALKKADRFDKFMLKIFTSGSFFDENELSKKVRDEILKIIENDSRIIKVIAETRPEFVTENAIENTMHILKDTKFEIAVGLETSSDLIKEKAINKGFSTSDFINASLTAKKYNATTKAYLLLKPPFIPEGIAMNDIISSIDDVANLTDTISINLCNIQNGTLVERLWKRKQYQPPWLWSIVEILKITKQKYPNIVIMSDPVGAGSKRGPRNCEECSGIVADAIRKFSIKQDLSIFDGLSCDCMELWKKIIEIEDYSFGSIITR
jgi:radical SAM enzyme (TIGR01210 family)